MYEKDAEETKDKIAELIKALETKYHIYEKRYSRHSVPSTYDLPATNLYREESMKVREQINSISTEIVATMELGGTKAELLEMINQVKF